MKSRQDIDNALAAQYALGTLRGSARLHFEKRLAQEQELVLRLGRWQTLLAPLENTTQPQTPPERVWKKIQLSLPPQKRASLWSWNYLGWALAAGLAAIVLVPYFTSRSPELAPLLVLNSSDATKEQWIVSADRERKTLQLVPVQPRAIAANNSLQLWAIPSGAKPISLGLVNASQTTQLTAGNVTFSSGMTIAISLEPQGGSPTGQPTGPVVFSGTL
jgi:anti-sigma-K factor RskA